MDDLKQLTPMMRQYMDIKKEHQDKVLFFRLGDFYEMFDKDAEEISHLLNLTLTHRGRTPMCGIPYHAMKNYLKRLLDAGKKVAICEQFLTGNPRELAERKVTQIYTPGTVVEDEYLDSFSSSFILSVSKDRKGIYTSWCDISTGEFYIRNLRLDKGYSELENLLESVKPKELLVPDDLYFSDIAFRETCDRSSSIITKLPIWYFSKKTGKEELEKHFSPNALRLYAIDPKDGILSVIGALLEYVEENAKSELPQLRTIERIEDESYIALNAAAVRNLELISSMTGSREGSLIDTIDRTLTSSGLRLLKFTLLHPLRKKEDIERRQRWVKRLMEDRAERERIRNSLQSSSDLERLSSKASMKRLTPRDFIAIADTIVAFFAMIQQRSEYMEFLDDELTGSFSDLISLSQDIVMGISRECTNISNEGTIILPGFDERLDELNEYVRNGSSILQEYLDKVTRETGISNIKTGENRIIGSYIEVSKGQLDKVPDYFIRRQTLVGGERFTTAELEEIKYRLSTAES
ncbi:MAG: DNA mismatch repair protein MutS, partial [Candidatus Ornithospirochaeta sp.]|nr:DNA mismatch repair protein MutS [Candidatus Ornithospirochaeta sp.]